MRHRKPVGAGTWHVAIVTCLETKYNRRRSQRALGKLTPIEFETIYAAADPA